MMKTFWIVDETWDDSKSMAANSSYVNDDHLPGEVLGYNSLQQGVAPRKADSASSVWKEEDVFLSGHKLVD